MRILPWVVLFLSSIMVGCNSANTALYPPRVGEPSFDFYVVNNHWHTGLVFKREMLSSRLAAYLQRDMQAPYLEIGWGDDGFYRCSETTTPIVLRALFYSNGSVFHVWQLYEPPEQFYQTYEVELYRIRISQAGLDRLNAYIERAFATDDKGSSVWIQKGMYPNSNFYKAKGRYSGFHTCNHWTADAVRETGFPITPMYSFTANNVGWQIKTFGKKYDSAIGDVNTHVIEK